MAGRVLDIGADDPGSTVVRLDGVVRNLGATGHAVLVRLAQEPGRVVAREDLLRVLPSAGHAGGHAVEVAVSRLRSALGDHRLVQTVVKRGYRLAVD